MATDSNGTNDEARDCTTTESFADHDIEDGSALIERTYYRLSEASVSEFESTASFFDALESAFIWAYLGSVEENGVPTHVEAAIDDARAFTREEFAEDDDPDLRTEVVPTFYRYAAGFHCAYRE
jgi:hypothetical protein